MKGVLELAPGIWSKDGNIGFCPGCGLTALGVRPDGAADVLDWCEAAVTLVQEMVGIEPPNGLANQVASAYLNNPRGCESYCKWEDSK